MKSWIYTFCTVLTVCASLCSGQSGGSTWADWWSYEGISGPGFWGLVNPQWSLCSMGKQQSPINIDPNILLFDPNLKHITIDKHRVRGLLQNTGHDLTLQIDAIDKAQATNITGGPLSYKYRIEKLQFHFGYIDSLGSEHTVDGKSFPAEVQIHAYNSDLYKNYTHASKHSHGLASIAILIQIGAKSNEELAKIVGQTLKVIHKGKKVMMHHLSVSHILPPTSSYMTYAGSTTFPGCHETVTWVVMNKPIYITDEEMKQLRQLKQTGEPKKNGKHKTQVSMTNNYRPIVPQNNRVVRTNINVPNEKSGCAMIKDFSYKANVANRK